MARWAVVAVVLALLVVPGRLLARQHESDTALVPYRDGGRATGRVAPGQTWKADAGVATSVPDRVRVIEVRPRVAVDTAQAVVTIELCRGNADPAATSVYGDAGCHVVDSPHAPRERVRLRPGHARLVVSVTPLRAGTVLIEGYDVTYVDGGRRGTEHAGHPVRLTAA